MKTRVLNLVMVLFAAGTMSLFAQDLKTEKFKVFGNCGMCETRIENAAKAVDGVTTADWDKKTKMLEVSFDASKVKILDIHKAVAAVGHDTELEKAEKEVYEALPGCCLYR